MVAATATAPRVMVLVVLPGSGPAARAGGAAPVLAAAAVFVRQPQRALALAVH